ncbi:MAG: protein kinase [bacterium]
MLTLDVKKYNNLIIMLMALGEAYLEKGLYAEAAKRYQQLLEFNVANKSIYTNLSKALIGLKKIDHYALEVYQKAIQYDPSNTELYDILASCFLNEARKDPQAIQIYEIALKYETPIFNQLADHLGSLYFKKRDFLKCKVVTEKLFQKSGFQSRPFSLFLQSCWKTGKFNDAITQIKRLIDTSENKKILLKYLCITYLEKKFVGEIKSQRVRFSYLDRHLVADYINKNSCFNQLQDLSLYLELKRFLIEKEHWGGLYPFSEEEKESVYVYQSLESSPEAKENVGHLSFNLSNEILERLSSFETLTGRSIGSHSTLTYEDFKKEGAAIFSKSERETRKWGLPENAEILITIEFSNYDHLRLNFGMDLVQQIRKKLYVILTDYLEKFNLTHIWGTSNGLLIFASDILTAVSFSVEMLNKLNRYNVVSNAQEEIHLTIGIHHAREGLGVKSEQTLKELCTGLKVGLVSERDLSSEDRAVYSKIFQRSDRIFLSGKAYREIKSSNRFKVHSIGQFRLRYLKESLSLHQVVWRNPLDDLKFGFIKKLGRFDLLADIGGKGVFKVFKAKDSVLQRFVILKVVQSEVFNSVPPNNQQKVAFYQLAKNLGQMSHPNIANIYEVDEDQALTYMAREFVEGIPITEIFRNSTQFNPERLVQIIYQICKGLQYSHRFGYYHYNLKPSNIRVGLNDKTKIMDFLIPRTLFEDYEKFEENQDQIYYLSPEQIHGKQGDGRSDIFSLGTILYQIVTRINPFAGRVNKDIAEAILYKIPPSPSELNNQIPEFFDAFIQKCIAKNPENRFQSVNQMVALLKKKFERVILSNFNYQISQSRDSI